MRQKIARAVLGLSGLMAIVIGGFILFDPHTFYSGYAITLGDDPNLLSEIRAPGGLLLAAGLVIIAGAVRSSLMRAAWFTAITVFGMYGVSRAIGIVLDGAPSAPLVGAMMIELLVAAILLFMLSLEAPTIRKQKREVYDAY